MHLTADIAESKAFVEAQITVKPTIGIILGSGLGPFADTRRMLSAFRTTIFRISPALPLSAMPMSWLSARWAVKPWWR